jgi:hypothetical protein
MAARARLPRPRIPLPVLLKVAIVLAAALWAFWPILVPGDPARLRDERDDRCRDARMRHELLHTAHTADEVRFYCERAR